MSDPDVAIALGRIIDLTREPDLVICGVVIRPTACEVGLGDRRVRLQPRVMQVLIALARAGGQPVSRETLVAVCWGEVAVGEDALNRCIQRLRRLSETEVDGAFAIETIPRLGYRLTSPSAAASTASATAADAPPRTPTTNLRPRRVSLAVLVMLLFLVLAGTALWLFRDQASSGGPPHGARIAVMPFVALNPGGALHDFSGSLVEAIVGELADSRIQAGFGGVDARAVPRPQADYLFQGTVTGDGKIIEVQVRLDDARDRVTIWSDTLRGRADAPDALRASVAAETAEVAHWTTVGRTGRVRLDPASLAAFIAGRDSLTAVRHHSSASALADFRTVVAAAPDFPGGHSGLAVAEALSTLHDPPPPSVAAVREDARREARRALELDPHDGEAYLALELSLPTLSWRERELLVTQGVTADPGFEPLALMEGRLLLGVGRNRESVAWLESAHDLDHLHNSATWSLALSLASQGRGADSDALVNSMVAQWPAHDATHDARFWTSLVTGRTDLTLTLLGDPEARPRGMDHGGVDAWRRVLQAKGKRDPAASALVKAAAAKGSLSHGEALTLLAMAGDLEGAFDQARLYQPGSPYLPPYLFLPFTRSMREDPRFIPLAKRLGYVAYWRATGHWPDFCAETGLRYDCRAAADETRS